MKPCRIALCVNLAPRKLGSFEDWIVGFAREARRRDHGLDVLGREPIHPAVAAELQALGAGWKSLDPWERQPVSAGRALAARYDVLHLNLFAPRSRFALIAYSAWPARVLFMDHFSDPPPSEATPRHILSRALDRLSMVRVTGVAGVSDYVRLRDRQRFRLPGRKIRTIYNGVRLNGAWRRNGC